MDIYKLSRNNKDSTYIAKRDFSDVCTHFLIYYTIIALYCISKLQYSFYIAWSGEIRHILKFFIPNFPERAFCFVHVIKLKRYIFKYLCNTTFCRIYFKLPDGKWNVRHIWTVQSIAGITDVTCTRVRTNCIVTSCNWMTRCADRALIAI